MSDEVLLITVRDNGKSQGEDGRDTPFKLKRKTKMSKVKKAFARMCGRPEDSVRPCTTGNE